MQPIPAEQVQNTAQILLTYLDDENNSTPNHMLEGIVSGKSLLRGILAGHLVICQVDQPQQGPGQLPPGVGPGPDDDDGDAEPPARNKVAKKKARKKPAK